MKKKMTYGAETRELLLHGAEKVNDAVRFTVGPQGRGVLLASRTGAPELRQRAAALAKEISFRDVTENAGAALLREVGEKAAERAGEGAELAMLLAERVMWEGNRRIAAGFSPVTLRRGLERCVPVAVQALREQAVRGPDRRTMAALACAATRDDTLGRLIAEAVEQVGTEGYISVRASDTSACRLEREDAFCLERGWISPYMATDKVSQETVFDDAAVLVCSTPINSICDILPLLNEISFGRERLLILADSIHDEVKKSFVSNLAQGTVQLCAVCVPGVGQAKQDWLADAAAYTGTVVYGTAEHPDLKAACLRDCGRAGRVRVTRENTRLERGKGGTALEAHLAHLRALRRLDNNELEDEILRRRIANLTGNMAVLRVGAVTELERRFLTEQAPGAIRAVFDAAQSGVVPGNGVAFVRAAERVNAFAAALDGEECEGAKLLAAALKAPLMQIAENLGAEPGVVLAAVEEAQGTAGFDAGSGELRDLFAVGAVDSLNTCVAALEVGVGLAAQILTVDAAVLIDAVPIEDMPIPDDLHLTAGDFV